jgi:TPR repeat protein
MNKLSTNAAAMAGIAVFSIVLTGAAAGLAPRLAARPHASVQTGIVALDALDFNEARRQFMLLADEGNQQGQIWLAHMDADGLGAPADGRKAAALLTKAAGTGSAEAARRLGELYRDGTSVIQNLGQAREWLQRAADKGDTVAERDLGEIYAQGAGVQKDPRQAYAWLALAASHGDGQAATERDRIVATLPPDLLATAEQQARATRHQIASAGNAPAGGAAPQRTAMDAAKPSRTG